jgi:catechol 2,3-dioxygenase-like lactoylglutathione lyase family enzyme
MDVAQIDHVAVAVSDVERSVEWYCEVLGMDRRHPEWGVMPAMVCAGETCVALFPVEGNPAPPPGRDVISMRHLAFRTDRAGFERAQAELRQRGIDFEFIDHETAHSIYFEDPDGHRLEITTYEPLSWEPLVRSAHNAFNRGDVDAFLSVWHERCEYRPALESDLEGAEGVYRGHGGIRRWWDRIHGEFEELNTELEEIRERGDRVLVVGMLHCRGRSAAW